VTPPIVVAPHPDDEVLGAADVLAGRDCVVVHVTDGVPPDAPSVDLAETRTRESRAAWDALGATVGLHVRLGFADQRVVDAVESVAHELALLIRSHEDVYVPAYQRGHPDHDAVYVAAQLARAEIATAADRGPPRRWFAYALYALEPSGRPGYGWLDPEYFAGTYERGGDPESIRRKRTALECFVSQSRDGSVLDRWLDAPVPERYAPLPSRHMPLPHLRCFYDEIFHFEDFGISSAAVSASLASALGGPI
jgi:LmbE family N-acetylglucosaminyl deacetylase